MSALVELRDAEAELDRITGQRLPLERGVTAEDAGALRARLVAARAAIQAAINKVQR
jgi:hypothetical protein